MEGLPTGQDANEPILRESKGSARRWRACAGAAGPPHHRAIQGSAPGVHSGESPFDLCAVPCSSFAGRADGSIFQAPVGWQRYPPASLPDFKRLRTCRGERPTRRLRVCVVSGFMFSSCSGSALRRAVIFRLAWFKRHRLAVTGWILARAFDRLKLSDGAGHAERK